MKAKIVTLVSALFFMAAATCAQAQGKERLTDNTRVDVEVAGPGVIASLNIDQRFSLWRATGLGARVGIGFGNFSGGPAEGSSAAYYRPEDNEVRDLKSESYFTFPFALNYVFNVQGPKHALELGVGGTYLSKKLPVYNRENNNMADAGNMLWHAAVMYRYIPQIDGVSLRMGLTPMIGTAGDVMFSGAVSLGYSF